MSLDRATARCPEIDLQGMVNALARPTRTKVERVIVNQPEYLESLSQILRETHQSTLQKFFIWRVIQSLGDYIESDALLPWLRFRNEIQGKVLFLPTSNYNSLKVRNLMRGQRDGEPVSPTSTRA
jgi:endothelin-converting enzyme